MLLLFALAFLPVVGAGIMFLMGLRDKAVAAKEAERCEIVPAATDVVD